MMEPRPTRAWDTAGPTSARAPLCPRGSWWRPGSPWPQGAPRRCSIGRLASGVRRRLGREPGQASHHSSQQPVLRPHLPGARTSHAQRGSLFPSALPAHRHPEAAYGVREAPNSVPARALGDQALARLCPHPAQSLPECCRLESSPQPSPLSHSIQLCFPQSPELPVLKAGGLVCRGPPDPRPHQSRHTGGREESKPKVWPVPESLGQPGDGISKHHHPACLGLPSHLSGAETEVLRGWERKGDTEAEGLRPQEARVHVCELSVHLPWSQPPSCPGAGNGRTGRWTPSFRPPQPRGVGPSREAGPLTRWPGEWASSQALTLLPAALAVAAPCRA